MIFCLGEGRSESKGDGYQKNNRVFNVNVSSESFDKNKSLILELMSEFKLTFWVKEELMTDEEKKDNLSYKILGGYLNSVGYKKAWEIFWRKIDSKTKNRFSELDHFNKDIFKEITGIDYEYTDRETIQIGEYTYDKSEVESRLKDIKPI